MFTKRLVEIRQAYFIYRPKDLNKKVINISSEYNNVKARHEIFRNYLVILIHCYLANIFGSNKYVHNFRA